MPALHELHCVIADAPVLDDQDPALHRTHRELLVLEAADDQVPALQLMHDAAPRPDQEPVTQVRQD